MFASKLKALRIENQLTQWDLAQILHVAQGAIANWETGKRTPDIKTIEDISDYFKVSVDWLTGKSRYRNENEVRAYNWGINNEYFNCAFDFCSLLKEQREALGMSIERMSSIIGITAEKYRECEAGEAPITEQQAEQLSKQLFTDVSQVLFDNGLYQEFVPEKYRDNVKKWEELSNNSEKEAMNEFYDENGNLLHYLGVNHKEDMIIKKYRALDEHGIKIFNYVLNEEYERSIYEPKPDYVVLSYIETSVSEYMGNELDEYESIDNVSVPLTKESRKADFVFKVRGDFMEPNFSDGDFILIRKQPAVDKGQIGLFVVDGNDYIRVFDFDKLVSSNTKYDDIVLNNISNFKCFGLVLGKTIVFNG